MIVIAVASLLYMGRMGLPIDPTSDTRSAQMRVSDSNGLVVGSKVLLRGIAIGEVADIGVSADNVTVTLEYDGDQQIPEDSRFRIESLSALGEAFVAVLPESDGAPYLVADAMVRDEAVIDPTPFPEFSQRLTEVLGQVDPTAVRSIFEILDVALPEEAAVTDDLERAGELLAATFIAQRESLRTVLETVQPLLMSSDLIPANLRTSVPHLADFGTGFSGVLDGVRFATIRGPLTSISEGAAPLLTELQHFLDVNAADLETIGVSILPGVTAGAARVRSIDISALFDRALRAVDDGAVTLELGNP